MAACLAWGRHEIPLERCQQFRINGRVLFPLFSGQLPACEASGTQVSGNRIAIVFPWVQAGAHNSDVSHEVALNAGLWLQSAAANADVADFLIIHDFAGRATIDTVLSPVQGRLPGNIRRMEVASVPQLYQERANLSFAPAAQFIARLKPCIGHVFATQLAGYSHWAYGDFDVAYGSLQRFLTPDLLRRHAIVTLRDESLCSAASMSWFAGQLTVFRNEEWVNQLFRAPMTFKKRVHDWKVIAFNSAVADHYDERGPYPTAAAEAAKERGMPVAYVASQLNDIAGLHFMLGEACGQPLNACGRLVWMDGRLLQIDNVWRDPTTGVAVLGDACIRTEAAFVHFGRIKFTDGRMCKINAAACSRSRSKKLGSWRWNFTTAGNGVEIRTPAQQSIKGRKAAHFGFVKDVGLRELEPWLADVVRHAAPNCSSFDMKHPVEMPNEYIRGREWAQSAKGPRATNA